MLVLSCSASAAPHVRGRSHASPLAAPPAPFLAVSTGSQSGRFAARGCGLAARAAALTPPARRLPAPAPVKAGTGCAAHSRRPPLRVLLPSRPKFARQQTTPLPCAVARCSWKASAAPRVRFHAARVCLISPNTARDGLSCTTPPAESCIRQCRPAATYPPSHPCAAAANCGYL
jgi:hypothetical protein